MVFDLMFENRTEGGVVVYWVHPGVWFDSPCTFTATPEDWAYGGLLPGGEFEGTSLESRLAKWPIAIKRGSCDRGVVRSAAGCFASGASSQAWQRAGPGALVERGIS